MKLLGGHARGQKPYENSRTASISVSSFTIFLTMTSHWPGFSLRDRIRFGVRTLHSIELAPSPDFLSSWDWEGHRRTCHCTANSQLPRKQHSQSLSFPWRLQSIMPQEHFPPRTNNCLELWEPHYNPENVMWKNETNKIVCSPKRKMQEKQHQHKFNYEVLFSP